MQPLEVFTLTVSAVALIAGLILIYSAYRESSTEEGDEESQIINEASGNMSLFLFGAACLALCVAAFFFSAYLFISFMSLF